jgi:pimeloyl-ACP methyl ester carboxylesterase
MSRTRAIAGILTGLVVGAALTVQPGAATADVRQGAPAIEWEPCRQFSDETLKWMIGPEELQEFKQLWARTDCGTLSVPLDYREPRGRQITVAVTRLRATDPAHRIGSLALNPGGPGGSGYFLPHHMVLAKRNGNGEKLNQRYDLIGFDPRGVGYSTRAACPDPGPAPSLMPSPITKEMARAAYDWTVRSNQLCANSDPAFLGRLTTTNVARDLDRIRRGLGERKLSYLGISWGTFLGASYRSQFPGRVGRMWLDSPAQPVFRLDAFEAGRAAATARDFKRFAAWLAERNDRYGFGSTASEVEAALTRMRQEFNAHPKVFSDLPGIPFDGWAVAQISAGFSLSWPLAGPVLVALRDAPGGEPAPPEVKQLVGSPPGDLPEPPDDLPEDLNPVMAQAVFCNEDAGSRDFETAWDAFQDRIRRYPVTGEFSLSFPPCAGWPLPVQPVRMAHNDASLVMSAHRWETFSPYEWALQTKAAIGGSVLTVNDDVHGSTAALESDCAPRIAAYFLGGKPDNGQCQGVPVPDDEQPAAAAPAEAAAANDHVKRVNARFAGRIHPAKRQLALFTWSFRAGLGGGSGAG